MKIKNKKIINLKEPIPVYDIEVKNNSNSHNFCANGIFVHNCMFGLLYGKTAFNFAKEWNCSKAEAQTIVDGLIGAYPCIQTYIETQHKFAIEHGYILDVFGIKRPLPEAQLPPNGNTKKLFSHAMNVAQNSPVQSSASRMAWIAGTHIAEEFILQNLQSKMIGGVHDSTYIDVYPGELIPVYKICDFHANIIPNKIYDWMNGNKMTIDCGIGQSWGRELDIKNFEKKDDNIILTLKGGNANWNFLKRELDEAYDYNILDIKDEDDIPKEEQEDLPIEVSTKYQTIILSFKDICPEINYQSNYWVGNGFFGNRK